MDCASAVINFVLALPVRDFFSSAMVTKGLKFFGKGNGFGSGASCFFLVACCCILPTEDSGFRV